MNAAKTPSATEICAFDKKRIKCFEWYELIASPEKWRVGFKYLLKWLAIFSPLLGLGLLISLEILVFCNWEKLVKLGLPPAMWVVLVGILFGAMLVVGSLYWLRRIDQHPLLIVEEKIQNKDSLVIGTVYLMVLLGGIVLVGAFSAECFSKIADSANAWRFYLPMMWAFAATAIGAAVGFLFGLPKPPGTPSQSTFGAMPKNYIHTGLDDIVDWLTKGVTTVALVKAETVLHRFPIWADGLAKGLTTTGEANGMTKAFAEGLLAFFPAVGVVGSYLVTRTYLTGALTRADRSTLGAFSQAGLKYADVLMLQRSWRALNSAGQALPAEAKAVAESLGSLTLADLHTPIEYALWAKAKSILGKHEEALKGYEKAVILNQNDPELLLDYSVALHMADQKCESRSRIEEAYSSLSKATEPIIRKNIYKSLSFVCLYQPPPAGYERALRLIQEYESVKTAPISGGLYVNKTCAWAQQFRQLAVSEGKLIFEDGKPIILPSDGWTTGMSSAKMETLKALKTALELDANWAIRFRELLQVGNARNGEDDLAVFENDSDFRTALGLPPKGKPPVT